jgi:outer membrane protein assembly factor BamD
LRRTLTFVLAGGLAFLCASRTDAQILHKKKKVNKSTSPENTAAPDQVLYNRALEDIKHGRQEVGRLGMQTLINTYPDSEYLAKAKLAIADSYYREGGTANLTLAIQGYKDFIVFFPFLPEAAYAQLQVANAHYHQMAKPDRDRSEARAAEEEYQTFLLKYPKDPLAAKAEQKLRDVQEIIAEGDYRVGYFYYVKGDKRAAAARLVVISSRYPLYSRSDKVLWMLGDIFEKSEHKEIASQYYSQIVKNYPLSPMSAEAKKKLVAFKVPVPQPDPQAMAWMRAEQNGPHPHDSLVKKPLGLIRSGPHDEILASAKTGQPNLQPEADSASATDILSGGNKSRIGLGPGTGNTAVVETVTPGGSAPAGGGSGTEGGQANEGSAEGSAPAAANPSGEATLEPTSSGTSAQPTSTDANKASNGAAPSEANGNSAANGSAAPAATQPSADPAKADPSKTDGSAQSDDTAKSEDSQSSSQDGSKKKESSSKKKKGLKKIVPW